eukprot:1324868-Prymnesium_polylepis.1
MGCRMGCHVSGHREHGGWWWGASVDAARGSRERRVARVPFALGAREEREADARGPRRVTDRQLCREPRVPLRVGRVVT